MAVTHLILVGSLVVFAHGAVSGAQGPRLQAPRPQAPAATAENPLVSKGKNPFARLFTSRQRLPETAPDPRASTANTGRQPRVVCGMVVVPVDPSADPKFVVREKAGVEYKMPRIEPQICRE
jgi:hypothetical protein